MPCANSFNFSMISQRNSDSAVRVFAAILSATTPALSMDDEQQQASTLKVSTDASQLDVARVLTSKVPALHLRKVPTAWTKTCTKRFMALSRKEALGTLQDSERRELEDLSSTRRLLLFPRTSDEIIADVRQRNAVAKLVSALHACAQSIPQNR